MIGIRFETEIYHFLCKTNATFAAQAVSVELSFVNKCKHREISHCAPVQPQNKVKRVT